jgi:Flp pilus assembly protein TadG
MMRRTLFPSRRAICQSADERGSSVLEMALVLPVLIIMLCVAIDLGRACTVAIAAESAAHAGALYGIAHLSDVAGMVAAAKLDAADWSVVTPTATFGCQCSDGSHAVDSCATLPSSCTDNIVNYVQVNTSAVFAPLLPYPGLSNSFTIHSIVRLRASQ